jgi:hypothetical protein
MKKKIRFSTVSIGSEPDKPEIPEVASFIRSHRGSEADLITFSLAQSVTAQKDAGIESLCAGGLFCLPRVESALSQSTGEWQHNSSFLVSDARMMTKLAGTVSAALPAPHLSEASPDPDNEEQYADYCDSFGDLLRDMRDAGIKSHILHTRSVEQIESERLASKKILFVAPEGDFSIQGELLEFQQTLTLDNSHVSMIPGLLEQYDIRSVTIINPDESGLKSVLEWIDPDQIYAGGYGTGPEGPYWRRLAEKATISINTG